jgi:cytochrome c oxidase assembly protein subunit 11
MMSEAHNEKRLVLRLLGVVVGMFAFGFALVPLYDVFCEITGANGKTAGKFTVTQAQKIDKQRVVTIQFLTNNNADMPWEFRPKKRMLKVHPGELNSTAFYVRNPANKTMVAQAVPSVSPFHAAEYLHKTECFCFDQQQLAQGEEMDMPLRFIIDADLPKDVNTLTLSYTLFDVTDQFGTVLNEPVEKTPKENKHSSALAVNQAGFD